LTVRQVTVPAAARRLATLERIDYADAFVGQIRDARKRTAEQWARVVLEEAPVATRNALRSGWLALGLRHGVARSDRSVLGWELRRSTPDSALLSAGSRVGLPGEVLFERRQRTLLLATFLQYENPFARALWAGSRPLTGRSCHASFEPLPSSAEPTERHVLPSCPVIGTDRQRRTRCESSLQARVARSALA
jgi:hypothetical protein